MGEQLDIDLARTVPTFVGSMLSMLATGSIFICYMILPRQKHFRHTLILNLAVADFVGALNNNISGIYVLAHGSLPTGPSCTLNALVGQVCVQATDFAVLFITIATVYTLRKINYQPKSSRSTKLLLTLGIWFIPCITGSVGLASRAYEPVAGNWCWIGLDKPMLRYALSHGWRFFIMVIIVVLYIYLFVYLHRHFNSLRKIEAPPLSSSATTTTTTTTTTDSDAADDKSVYEYNEFEVFHEFEDGVLKVEIPAKARKGDLLDSMTCQGASSSSNDDQPLSHARTVEQNICPDESEFPARSRFQPIYKKAALLTRDPLAIIRRPPPKELNQSSSSKTAKHIKIKAGGEYQIMKVLLLNAYPIAYIILWIPGITNRFLEMTEYRKLGIAQSTTQYVGLANACVFWYNEKIWTMLSMWWKRKQAERKCRKSGMMRPGSMNESQINLADLRAPNSNSWI